MSDAIIKAAQQSGATCARFAREDCDFMSLVEIEGLLFDYKRRLTQRAVYWQRLAAVHYRYARTVMGCED